MNPKTRKRVALIALTIILVSVLSFPVPQIAGEDPIEYITVYESTAESGYQAIYYGLIPSLEARYIVDIEWLGDGGVTLGIGGIELYCYNDSNVNYINGTTDGGTEWSENVGASTRQTIIVDSYPNTLNASISVVGNFSDQELALYKASWYEPDIGRLFTPFTVDVVPNGATVNVYNITQQVEDKGLVTAIGSTKYQGIGYDGPSGPSDTNLSMSEIRDAGMSATIFADVTYINLSYPDQINWLNTLVDEGWDLGIHFAIWDPRTMDFMTEVWPVISDQYVEIAGNFSVGNATSWCFLGIGAMPDDDNNTYIANNIGSPEFVPFRGLRVVMQALKTGAGLYDVRVDDYRYAIENGSALPPVYMHDTDGGGGASDLSRANWITYFDAVNSSDIKLTGYDNVYYMLKNQEDATFVNSTSGGDIQVNVTTNGYNATIVVKTDYDQVFSVNETETGLSISYNATPADNYVTFEVEDGKNYTIETGYTLDITIVGNGTIAKNPDKAVYDPNENVTLTTTADGNYTFYSWTSNTGDIDEIFASLGDPEPYYPNNISAPGWGLLERNGTIVFTMNQSYTINGNFAFVVNRSTATDQGLDNWGIRLTADFDGVSNNGIYNTPYFVNGYGVVPDDGGKPVFELIGTGITLSNVVVDDLWHDIVIRNSIWPYPASGQWAIGIRGTNNSVINCTLRNNLRYGIATYQATNFTIQYNLVEFGQHGISGSGGASYGGVVAYNYVTGAHADGLKINHWHDGVFVYNNFFDGTPYYGDISPASGSGAGGDFNSDYNNSDVDVYNNTFIRYEQPYDYPQSATLFFAEVDLSGDDGSPGVSNLRFFDNILYKVNGTTTTGISLQSGTSYITIENNTIYNCDTNITDAGSNNIISGNLNLTSETIPEPPLPMWRYGAQLGGYVGEEAGDETVPTYSNPNTNTTLAGASIRFQVTLEDETQLDSAIIGHNNSGQWVNGSVIDISGFIYILNETDTLNETEGIRVEWQVWFNDSSDNWANTGIQFLVVTGGDWTGILVGVTNPAKIMGIDISVITKVNGIS